MPRVLGMSATLHVSDKKCSYASSCDDVFQWSAAKCSFLLIFRQQEIVHVLYVIDHHEHRYIHIYINIGIRAHT